MLNGGGSVWRFKGNGVVKEVVSVLIKSVLFRLFENCSKDVKKIILFLGYGDLFVYFCFKIFVDVEEVVFEFL